MERRPYPPGLRMTKRRRSTSEYNTQLREKQKIKRMYGMMEKQFRLFFRRAVNQEGVTGENLLKMLEQRLENVVFRLGFAPSRAAARQLVLHNHFLVNDKKVNIPSYLVKEGDVVMVKEKSKNIEVIHGALRTMREVPEWLQIDKVKLSGTVLKIPDRASIPSDIQERLVVELYSK
jgi:small subunit ribosomal protein S4